MQFGSIYVSNVSNLTINVNVNMEGAHQPVATPQPAYTSGALIGLAPIEVFSNRSSAAQSMLEGYLKLVSIHDKNAFLTGRQYYVEQLNAIATACPWQNLDPSKIEELPIDEQIIVYTWDKFFAEVCNCIANIESTLPWLRSSFGAVSVNPELTQKVKGHIEALKVIDRILAPFLSEGQATNSTQTGQVCVTPSSQHGSARRILSPRRPVIKTENAENQKVIFSARHPVNAEMQTESNDQSHAQRVITPHEDKETQTEIPTKIAVANGATQSLCIEFSDLSVQTGNTFPRDVETQTPHKEFEEKDVETTRLSFTDAGVQTDSEVMQEVDSKKKQFSIQETVKLQDEIEKRIRQIMAYVDPQPGSDCWQDAEIMPRDLHDHLSEFFCAFKEKTKQGIKENEKSELWSTFSNFYLPCLEQIRLARSQLIVSLFNTQFSEQNQKKNTIKSVIRDLDRALQLPLENGAGLQGFFAGADDIEKKSVLDRWQTFSPNDGVLNDFLARQHAIGKLVCAEGDQSLPISRKTQSELLSIRKIKPNFNSTEIKTLNDVECMRARHNDLVNHLFEKTGLFEHASKSDIENFMLHMWLPSVAYIKLLAQKNRHANAEGKEVTILEREMSNFLRDARWGLNMIISSEFNDKGLIKNPVTKRLLEGFEKIAQPESLGLLGDASLLQDLIKNNVGRIYHSLAIEHREELLQLIPVSILAIYLEHDHYTLALIEEWSNLIIAIKDAWRKALPRGDDDSSGVTNYLNYLKQAKTFYQMEIKHGISKEEEARNFEALRMMLGSDVSEAGFDVEGKHAKSLKILKDLGKNLGL